MNRPEWCPDKACSNLTSLYDTDHEKTGTCIGKLSQPTDHGDSKGVNDKRWCVMSGKLSSLMVNNEDFEFFIYQMVVACKRDGIPLKLWMVKDELSALREKEDY